MEKALAKTRIFVSPIQFSTGVNTKNLLALERATPLITSVNGSSGLCPENLCHTWPSGPPFLVANNHSHFTDLVELLYGNESLWKALSRSGKAYTTSVLSVQSAANDVDKSLHALALV